MSQPSSDKEISKLLLVENSRTARAFMQQILEDAGFAVTPVATGPEAIEFLKTNSADAIVMDVFMPLMNGYEATKLIRESEADYADIPIVAYSASHSGRDKNLCLEAGMNEFIQKTDDHQELIEWLRNN